MPFLTGAMSFREYKVEGAYPPNYRKAFEDGLARYAFRAPQPARGETRAAGWANPRRLLDPDLTFPALLIDDYLFAALRVDRLALNPRLFKARLAERMAAKSRELGRKRLARADRDALADVLKREMLAETSPTTSVYEWVWHLEGRRVFFASAGEKLNAEFSDLFEECFNLALTPLFTYFRALDWAQAHGKTEALDVVAPSGGML
ncbi:MAG: hypothetical protein Kow0059_11520 [Candidatus Sumerlaeia bacterium]